MEAEGEGEGTRGKGMLQAEAEGEGTAPPRQCWYSSALVACESLEVLAYIG